MSAPPLPPPPPPRMPSLQLISEGVQMLRDLQAMLGNMGRARQQDLPEFQEMMGLYKALGGDLHQAKQRSQAAALQPPKKADKPIRKEEKPIVRPHQSLSGMVQDKLTPGQAAVPAAPRSPGADRDDVGRQGAQPEAAPAAGAGPVAAPRFVDTMGPVGRGGVVSMGEEVGQLQRVLTHLGYRVEETEAYDKETVEAVIDFQRDHGLKPTGIVGADMRALLNQVVSG